MDRVGRSVARRATDPQPATRRNAAVVRVRRGSAKGPGLRARLKPLRKSWTSPPGLPRARPSERPSPGGALLHEPCRRVLVLGRPPRRQRFVRMEPFRWTGRALACVLHFVQPAPTARKYKRSSAPRFAPPSFLSSLTNMRRRVKEGAACGPARPRAMRPSPRPSRHFHGAIGFSRPLPHPFPLPWLCLILPVP